MQRESHIVLLFEDGITNEDCIIYAIELAMRMKCSLAVLMLMPDKRNETKADTEMLNNTINKALKAGIKATGDVRYGDKASEFLKFIAKISSLHTIVWGSREHTLNKKKLKRTNYWLNKLTETITCPIVSPMPKSGKAHILGNSSTTFKKES